MPKLARVPFSPRFTGALLFAGALLGAASCAALAAPGADAPDELPRTRGRDKLDVEYAREIAAHTTDPQFLTEWVDHLPASRKVPTPKQFLGYSIGTPGQLTQPERINEYFRALDQASGNVEVFSMGTSDGGRELIVAAVGSKRNLGRLDEIKAKNRELADPRATDEARARAIAKDTPPIYWLTAGLHSPETGSPEMVMELAYRLAVSEQDHIREIRDNVVVLISPVLEMDGRARVVDWFYRHLTKVTDLDDSPPRSPPFWGDYTFHDNNRDGLQQTQRLTRAYTETFHEYLPVLTLDLHESVPLLYVSTGTGPYNEAIDPITVTQWQWIAGYEVATATKLGLQGVWTWGFYDGWYPGYILWVSNNHNATGRFYETFGNSNPNTFERELDEQSYAGGRVNTREWYRAWPPDKKVQWSLRNNTNYMQTAALASLQLAARHGEELLFDYWQKGQNGITAGKTERPHAFVIPREGQRDDAALHRLLELLAIHRIEVDEAAAAIELRGVDGPVQVAAGDFIVRMDQPYRNLAKTLLLAQSFPKTAKQTPYDDVAWSLDLMLGVTVRAIDDPQILALDRRPLAGVPKLEHGVDAGERWIVDHRGQASLASLRWALPNAQVRALTQAWQGHPAGSLILSGVTAEALRDAIAPLHLRAQSLAAEPDASVETVAVELPRVAVFHCWNYTQDSGWLRFTFEQLGIPFTLIDKDELRAGNLNDRFDVILVPSLAGLDFKDMVHELDDRWSPLAYTQTPEFPSHGSIDSSPDITGGMGFVGLANLQAFVEAGGVLVTLGSAGVLAAEGGITRDVEARRPGGTPGSHVTTKVVRPEHPLAWGYETIDWVFRGNLPVYGVDEHDWGHTIMQFGSKTWADVEREADQKADVAVERAPLKDPVDADATSEAKPSAGKPAKLPLARSGVVEKPEGIEHQPALLDVPVGKGRVVLFSWNPMHRHQNEHDFGFVTNALLFFNDFPAVPSEDQMRAREQPAREP